MACGKSNAPVSGVVAWLLLVIAALLILPIVVQVDGSHVKEFVRNVSRL